ncbi:MAG: MazG nucleotide pyrophosphohydrolase domain-containing protein [Candidatus Liptonbacteria bacterium]|nr:MazG nucleotide pyrophosphohydrolase domain-containing protein [Candidatus Liptonbacteria bacterium]
MKNLEGFKDAFRRKLNSYETPWSADQRVFHLMEEVGEFAEIILQYQGVKRPPKSKKDVAVALGDIIDDVFALAVLYGIDIEEVLDLVLKNDQN